MPLRLSERTRSSRALSTISRLVLRRVSLRALRTKLSSISMFVLPMPKAYTISLQNGVCSSVWHRSCELLTGQRASFFDGEFVGGDGVVAGSGVQDRRGEFRLVGGIGKVLGFQAEGGALGISEPALANSCAVKEIAGIKLDAGFGGPDFHDAAGSGLEDARGERFALVHGHAQDEVVIVAAAEFQLLVGLIDARPDGGGFAKVEGRVRHVAKFAGGNQTGIDGSVLVGVNHEQVAEDVAGTLASEIEITVAGEIDHGFFIGGGGIFNF